VLLTCFSSAIAGIIKIGAGIFKIFTDPVEGVKLILSGFVSFLRGTIINPIVGI
jgi:hypothetical protein